jgi:hypothetical protein
MRRAVPPRVFHTTRARFSRICEAFTEICIHLIHLVPIY